MPGEKDGVSQTACEFLEVAAVLVRGKYLRTHFILLIAYIASGADSNIEASVGAEGDGAAGVIAARRKRCDSVEAILRVYVDPRYLIFFRNEKHERVVGVECEAVWLL